MYIHTYTHVYTCIHIHVDLFEQTLFVYTVVYIYTIEVSKIVLELKRMFISVTTANACYCINYRLYIA